MFGIQKIEVFLVDSPAKIDTFVYIENDYNTGFK